MKKENIPKTATIPKKKNVRYHTKTKRKVAVRNQQEGGGRWETDWMKRGGGTTQTSAILVLMDFSGRGKEHGYRNKKGEKWTTSSRRKKKRWARARPGFEGRELKEKKMRTPEGRKGRLSENGKRNEEGLFAGKEYTGGKGGRPLFGYRAMKGFALKQKGASKPIEKGIAYDQRKERGGGEASKD